MESWDDRNATPNMGSPTCAEVNYALNGLTGLALTTREQHKDVTEFRQERDTKDTLTIATL